MLADVPLGVKHYIVTMPAAGSFWPSFSPWSTSR